MVLINPRIGGLMGDPWWRMHPLPRLSIILKKQLLFQILEWQTVISNKNLGLLIIMND